MEDLIKLSLKNLQVDYVDLYLIHFPVGFIGKDYKDVYPTDENGMTVFNFFLFDVGRRIWAPECRLS